MGKRTRAGLGICLSICQKTDAVWFRWQRKIDQTRIVKHLKTKATNEIQVLYHSYTCGSLKITLVRWGN